MASLSSKSAQEISELLDEYGIKHGPVVDSTRSLYEKKLKEAMAKERKAPKYKQSPDKTYYREEEEEVTYVYRTPTRSEGGGDSGPYMRSTWAERQYDDEPSYSAYSKSTPNYRGKDFVDKPYMYDTPSTYRNTVKSTPMKSGQDAPKPQSSSRLIPLWVQCMFFAAMVFFLYLVFSNMETNESLKGIE